jgi:endonuclease YncB( thermonuclease family)
MVEKIIAGRQTGAERAAIDVALELKIPFGGWCPKGRRVEDGRINDWYPLKEIPSTDCRVRTRLNVQQPEGTLVITRGPVTCDTDLTIKLAREKGKPLLIIDLNQNPEPGTVKKWLKGFALCMWLVPGRARCLGSTPTQWNSRERLSRGKLMKRGLLGLLIGVCAAVIPSLARAWSGKVVGVAAGDTITVLHDRRQEKIRLWGIDCPETGQDFGARAKQFTSKLVFSKVVDVSPVTTDRSGRTVALVRVRDTLVNEELIRAGLAWVYTRYCDRAICNDWKRLEAGARDAKRGLWSMPTAVPPWEFRRGRTQPN